MSEEGTIQVVIIEALRPQLEDFLRNRGLFLFKMPNLSEEEEELPTYGIGISDVCSTCGQSQKDDERTGEYPCCECNRPTVWDATESAQPEEEREP